MDLSRVMKYMRKIFHGLENFDRFSWGNYLVTLFDFSPSQLKTFIPGTQAFMFDDETSPQKT